MKWSDADMLATLRRYWGYDSFRPAQAEIIRSVLSGHDTIGLLPTGGGKSITFQVPALMMGGLTVVVTPLISLMKDQADNLYERGVRAVYIHSGLSRREMTLAIDRCRLGKARLLYISPERLGSESFIDTLRRFDVRLVVVDEAHCISQWGYDFRPSYLRIDKIRKLFPSAPMLALTASATPDVIKDIAKQLAMTNPNVYKLSFTRDNISYVVRYCDYKEGQAIKILQSVPGSAIIYVRSRVRSRQIASALAAAGISADYYHAGLQPQDKDERQNRWKSGQTRVMVATNAFGMGIDKPDVRVVIHHDLPSSLEEYYQEAGRAGRDGKESYAVLLANKTDKSLLSRRLAEAFPPKDTIKRVYEMAGNFLDVGVGEGYNRLFEFNIDLFCSRFKFMPAVVSSSLGILTQAGYIEYNEELTTRSRLMMLMTREELYDLTLAPDAESVLQFVLRSYTGIFADYEVINEPTIAMRLSMSEERVYQALLLLTRLHVLHYIPRQTCPYIFYTTSREEPRYVSIPIAVYDDRRKRMEGRVEAMKRFAFASDKCRVRSMLEYFGEEPEGDCGKCDVCRARRSRPATADYEQGVEESVMYQLSHPGEHTVDEVVASLQYPSQQTIAAIRRLADRGKIDIIDGILVPRR